MSTLHMSPTRWRQWYIRKKVDPNRDQVVPGTHEEWQSKSPTHSRHVVKHAFKARKHETIDIRLTGAARHVDRMKSSLRPALRKLVSIFPWKSRSSNSISHVNPWALALDTTSHWISTETLKSRISKSKHFFVKEKTYLKPKDRLVA